MTENETRNCAIVRRLWQLFEAREWQRARKEFHEDFEARWPHTGEVFRGAENFVAINENFPPIGEWHIEIKHVVGQGNVVASEIVVTHDYGLSYAASFFEMKAGKIYRLTEYWIEVGSEEPPEWRTQWVDHLEHPPTFYGKS